MRTYFLTRAPLARSQLTYIYEFDSGMLVKAPATDLEIDTVVKEMFEVNVYGVMRMVQEFVHLLIAAEGTIVNIGSVAALIPYVYGSAYSATKGALHSYGDTLRVEMKPFKYVLYSSTFRECGVAFALKLLTLSVALRSWR